MSDAVRWDLPTLPNPFPSDLESVWHEERLESSTAVRLNDCCLLIPNSKQNLCKFDVTSFFATPFPVGKKG